jgi:CDP-diacylglycerol--serine O-phosphatidyltransferase
MKKIPLLPNIITAFGLTCGLFAIFKMNMTGIGEVNYQLLSAVTGFLLLAALADLLDGAVARALKVESEFGGIFDSLADAISFGLAPPIIILKSLSVDPGTEISFLVTSGALIYSMCGILRLVRFNVMSNAEKGDAELAAANKKNFTGLPIPAAAAAAISANLIFFTDRFHQLFSISPLTHAWVMLLVMVTCGYFMISRWKFPSAKSLRVRIASFRRVFLMVIAVVLIFYGMLNHFAWVFFALSWSYLIVAWTLSLVRLISGKRLKTLEDYEPEPEDELDE